MTGNPTVRSEPGRRWRRPRLSLLARFAAVALVMTAALGVGLSNVLERTVRERAIADAERTAAVALQIGILPSFEAGDLTRDFAPLEDGRLAELGDQLGTRFSDDGVVRIKLWNRQHWIVYSDNENLRGRWFPGRKLLDRAFAGDVGSEITDLDDPEEMEERLDFGELLAVYVPLRVDSVGHLTTGREGAVIGAFEIYLPYAPIAAAIAADARELKIGLGIGLALLYLAVFRLVYGASRRLQRQTEENLHQALHDSLTGLPNRALFNDRVEQALALSRRDGTDIAVMIIDLDRFKVVNDTLGHHHGDEILVQIANRLRERLRWSDSVARLGGDEFAILLPRIKGPDDARLVAVEIHRLLERPIPVKGIELDIHGSIGVAVSPAHGDDAATLLQHADVAMYVAKKAHSQVEVYDPALDFYSAERLELAAELRDAIELGQLVVHYQPKVDGATREVVGVEALVRWAHPERGLLGPGAFLPAIEHTELMRPLTDFVLEASMIQAATWRRQGWEVPVAVNLSARTVCDEQLPDRVSELLARHGLPTTALELELTESAVLSDPDRAAKVLQRLDDLGIHLSIDDFGSGYASVAYLTQLPIRTLKIDQQFVIPMLRDARATSIVRFTLDLAETLGLTAVAEGVEDEETAVRLVAMGCDVLQGYGIRRPAPAAELVAFLEAHARATTDVAP